MSRYWLWTIFACLTVGMILFGFLAVMDAKHALIKVEWATASEVDTAGFNIYRSDHPDLEFVQLNHELIPASQQPLTGGIYFYLDEEVIPGNTYYYQLEDVDMNGLVNRHGPVEIRAEAGRHLNLIIFILIAGTVCVTGLLLHYKHREPYAIVDAAADKVIT